jgi:signal peptide peptidase SppA
MMVGLLSLLGEPLAMDLRGMPQLLESLRHELSAGFDTSRIPGASATLFCEHGEVAADQAGSMPRGSMVAVVPLVNVVTRHGYWGAVGTLQLGRMLQQLDADPAVGSIVLSVNSPGGSVYGTTELASIVRGIRSRGQTRTVAVADPLMASAATWIGTASDKVYAIESADVGSIGVLNSYADLSKYYEDMGIKIDVLRTPDKKARFSGVEPMTDAMRETMQARIDEAYQSFLGAMAENRGVTVEHVESRFGGGEVMGAKDAVAARLIDGIASLDDTVGQLLEAAKVGIQQAGRRRADAAMRELQIEKLK